MESTNDAGKGLPADAAVSSLADSVGAITLTDTNNNGGPLMMKTPSGAQQNPSALQVPPEILVHVATYLDVGHHLTNYCVAIGRFWSTLVRREYLADNEAYLTYCLTSWHVHCLKTHHAHDTDDDSTLDTSPENAIDINGSIGFQRYSAGPRGKHYCHTKMELYRQKILAWMEANPWKRRCLPPIEDFASDRRSTISILVKGKQARRIQFQKSLGGYLAYTGCTDGFEKKMRSHKVPVKCGDTLLAIDDVPIVGDDVASNDHLEELFKNTSKKFTITFLLSSATVSSMFRSPMVAVTLGLTNVLDYMLGKGMVDINRLYPAVTDRLAPEKFMVTVLYASIACLSFWVNNPSFEYLLTRQDLDLSVRCSPGEYGQNIIQSICAAVGSLPSRRLQASDDRENEDENAESSRECQRDVFKTLVSRAPVELISVSDSSGNTPLHSICGARSFNLSAEKREEVLCRISVLLSAGADPMAQNAAGRTPLELSCVWLQTILQDQSLSATEGRERRSFMKSVITLLANNITNDTSGNINAADTAHGEQDNG